MPTTLAGTDLPPSSYAATWANVGASSPTHFALFEISSGFPATVEWRPLARCRESVIHVAVEGPDLLKELPEFDDKREVRPVARHRAELAAAASALSITFVFFLWLVLHVGGDNGVRYFDDIVTALAALSACVACLLAGRRRSGPERRFWVLLGLALGAWTFAEVIWGVYDLVLNTAVPVPSWADVGYLGAIPLAAAALLCHPGMHTAGSHKTRATLDGLAIGAAVLLLSWTFVLGSLWHHTDLTTAGGIVALAYPFGDIVIIFLIVLSVRSMTATGRRPLLWVLVGLFAMAVSDSTYAYLVEAGRYSTGNLVDIGWVVGYFAIAVGASADTGQMARAPSELPTEASLASLVTPYVPVLFALIVITFELELHHHVDRFSWLSGLALALLALARQAFLLVDRHRELFSASEGPHEPSPKSSGFPSPLGSEPEAAPWPQFVRRTP